MDKLTARKSANAISKVVGKKIPKSFGGNFYANTLNKAQARKLERELPKMGYTPYVDPWTTRKTLDFKMGNSVGEMVVVHLMPIFETSVWRISISKPEITPIPMD